MTTPDRLTAWAYLRRVFATSRPELLSMLWPDGNMSAPARVIETANAIRNQSPDLPTTMKGDTGQAATQAADDLAWCDEHGARLITPDDDEWPAYRLEEAFGHTGVADGLKPHQAAPFALFAKGTGHLAGLLDDAVSVIGGRAATRSTIEATHSMVEAAVNDGRTIVSTSSVGTDTAAHKAALNAGGNSVVVAASGLGNLYPARNADLFSEVEHGGLVITEYCPTIGPARLRLLARYRLVTALSAGTLVMAAGYRSATVATAELAVKMGRPLMVYPSGDRPDRSGNDRILQTVGGHSVTNAGQVRTVLDLCPVDSQVAARG